MLLVAPHKEGTFDHLRPITTLDHLILNSQENVTENDETHFREVLKLTDYSRNEKLHSPKISVWMTCCDQEKYIGEAVQSVLNQTLMPYEILISDDCSTDRTRKILKEFELKFPDLIKVYYQPVRVGITKNKNFILSKVKGEYVTWLDGDDRFHPQKLEKEIEQMQRHPEARIVFSNVNKINSAGAYVGDWLNDSIVQDAVVTHQKKSDTIAISYFPAILFVGEQFAHLRNELISKQILDAVGTFDENIILWQDYEHRIRMFKKNKAIHYPFALQDYRNHTSASRHSLCNDHFNDLVYIYHKHIRNIQSWRPNFHWYCYLPHCVKNNGANSNMPRFPIGFVLISTGLIFIRKSKYLILKCLRFLGVTR